MVLNIAHRGASGSAPENTLAAFKKAVEIGADMIELDVQLSKDRELIVLHDDSVDRTTNGKGQVKDLSLEEIKSLDAGSWFAAEFAGERVPTLVEALAIMPEAMKFNIHLKPAIEENQELEQVLATLRKFNALDRSLIATSHISTIHRLRKLDKNVVCVPLLGQNLPGYIELTLQLGLKVTQPTRELMYQEFVDRLHHYGLVGNVFWADDEEDMTKFIRLGIDGIITNYPERLKHILDTQER